MKLKHLLCCGAAIGFVATGSTAATIKLIDQGGVAGSPAALGFKIAADYWGSILTNNVTINLGVRFAPLATGIIGSTGSNSADYSLANWENRVNLTKSNSALDQSIVLPTLTNGGASFITNGSSTGAINDSRVLQYVEGTTVSSKTLDLNTAVIKAIGGFTGSATALDGNVTFSSNFGFDFDPTNGITAGTFDFVGVAIHEIGHALGFVSGVDFLDQVSAPGGPTRIGYAFNNTSIYSALDMFRYSTDPKNIAPGTDPVLDLSAGGVASYFSIDGGKTALFGNRFSTGSFNGDGNQASHWKDTPNTPTPPGCPNPQLGIMDPTFCYGQMGEVTALDLASFDAMGWNTSIDALRNPTYRASTAAIYRSLVSAVPEPTSWAMMLTGFAMLGGALRGRRGTRVRVAFQG